MRRAVIFLAALIAPPAVAAALIPLRADTAGTNLALVMVVVVVAVAVPGHRFPAAVAGLGAGVWFDFFQTRPYYSFTISRHDDIETTLLLLIVGLTVGELTARGRRHRAHATEVVDSIGLIHHVAEMVAAGVEAGLVIEEVTRMVRGLLELEDCWFETTFAERPGPFIERQGGVSWGAITWSAGTMGLPSKEVTLVVEGQGRPYGRFVLVPRTGVPVSIDRLTVAVALADQVGAALAGQSA
ncbi:MAG: DUF4118 domain-containing protein [Acidimicrobiales bacterium]